jgi:hypothetical protein
MSKLALDGRAMPLAKWPERDRRAWIDAQKGDDDDLLGVDRPAARWRPSTKELYVCRYGIWLNFLKSQDLLDPEQAPETRVTQTRIVDHINAERGLGLAQNARQSRR